MTERILEKGEKAKIATFQKHAHTFYQLYRENEKRTALSYPIENLEIAVMAKRELEKKAASDSFRYSLENMERYCHEKWESRMHYYEKTEEKQKGYEHLENHPYFDYKGKTKKHFVYEYQSHDCYFSIIQIHVPIAENSRMLWDYSVFDNEEKYICELGRTPLWFQDILADTQDKVEKRDRLRRLYSKAPS